MTQLGLRIYIAFKLNRLFPKKKFFFISFVGGSFFPDIDIILVALSSFLIPLNQSIFLFHKTITHSIVTLSAIYLILLIVYEIKIYSYSRAEAQRLIKITGLGTRR